MGSVRSVQYVAPCLTYKKKNDIPLMNIYVLPIYSSNSVYITSSLSTSQHFT